MYFLRLQNFLLFLVGYDLKPTAHKAWKTFGIVNLLLVLVMLFNEMVFVIENLSDIKLATDALCTCLFGFSSFQKLVTLRLNRLGFYRLICDLRKIWTEATDTEISTHLWPMYQVEHKLSLSYVLSTATVGVLYLVFPIISSYHEMRTYGNTTRIMPMRATFFYDTTVTPKYELTYLWFTLATFFVAFGTTAIDSLFYASTFNLSGHFRILQDRIVRLQYESKNGRMTRHFFNVIQYHQKLYQMCDHITVIYKPIIFCQFVISSLQLCVVAYQLTLPTQDIIGYITYVIFITTICFQCFVYCNGGTQLEIESKAVADAIYQSNWYQTSCFTQKSILFWMCRSQKPVVLKSNFFSANLATFTSIINTAGSYTALLRSISSTG